MKDDGDLTYRNSGNTGLLNLLPSTPGRILDCGCGAGDNARILKDLGWHVTGVTIDPREQHAARMFCEAVHLADLEDGLPSSVGNAFDAILASHVLEHLVHPERLLLEARQRLKSGGVLAVALPNIAHYGQRISLGRGQFTYTDTGQLDRTHLRFYTYVTAIRLLEQNGYRLLSSKVEGGLPWWKARILFPTSLMARADKWAVSRWPNLLGRQSILLAQPR